MNHFTYDLILGAALGIYALVVLYIVAEFVWTWRNHNRDEARRFFVDAGGSTLHAELRRAADELTDVGKRRPADRIES